MNKTPVPFLGAAILVVVGGLAAAVTTNVGGFLTGYGLIYAVMLYAIWQYEPSTAALLVLAVEVIALPFYLISSSLFVSIAIFNVILRPLMAYFGCLVSRNRGKLVSTLALTLTETLIALSVDVLLFGSFEAGYAIYGIFLAPFVYLIVKFVNNAGSAKILGILAAMASLLAYFFSVYAFPAIATAVLAVVSLALLFFGSRQVRSIRVKALSGLALVLVVFGFALGGSPLQNNFNVALYPFNPRSWSSATRWEQTSSACPQTSNVFASVWTPSRLRIVNPCVTVVGTVGEQINAESDGDYAFNLSVNATYSSLLSLNDRVAEGNELHVEVVPADQHRELDLLGGGVCPGDLLKVTGVLVVDADHGIGSELHPAMNIARIQNAPNSARPTAIWFGR